MATRQLNAAAYRSVASEALLADGRKVKSVASFEGGGGGGGGDGRKRVQVKQCHAKRLARR